MMKFKLLMVMVASNTDRLSPAAVPIAMARAARSILDRGR
jgi:hypothetical protein